MSNDHRRSEQPEPIETPEQILDAHAKWYIKRTISFMYEDKEPSYVTGTNEQDNQALAALDRYYKAHTPVDTPEQILDAQQPSEVEEILDRLEAKVYSSQTYRFTANSTDLMVEKSNIIWLIDQERKKLKRATNE